MRTLEALLENLQLLHYSQYFENVITYPVNYSVLEVIQDRYLPDSMWRLVCCHWFNYYQHLSSLLQYWLIVALSGFYDISFYCGCVDF